MKGSRLILSAGLVLIGGLAVFSVYGAFLGADRAAGFFNSPPMVVFWFVLIGILCGGFFRFRRLWTHPFLFMIHTGCLLVLIGGLWGSEQGIALRNQYLDSQLFYKGLLLLYEGQGLSVLYDEDGRSEGDLPFEVRLEEFEVQYYDMPQFVVRDKAHPQHLHAIAIEAGRSFTFGHEDEQIGFSVIRSFGNLQIQIEEGKISAVEGPPEAVNPGYEVRFVLPDGSEERQFVFERFPVHSMPRYRFEIRVQPPQMPAEFISELVVLEGGQEMIRKRIEVNHPLSYKGYLFHQKSWGRDENGAYSIIGVVSNSGLAAVFAGYGLLAVGVIGQLWIVPAAGRIRQKGGRHNGD